MLAEGVSDRFTRFVPSDKFSSMNSYDITGVGLNISTAAELEDKTDIKAPRVRVYLPLPLPPPFSPGLQIVCFRICLNPAPPVSFMLPGQNW
jgi:hypothetical protein